MKFVEILLVFVLLSVNGCKEKTTLYYPNKDWFESGSSLVKINHRALNFEQLRNEVSNIYQKEKVPYIEIHKGDTVSKVIPMQYDGYGLYKGRNFITITKDSVFTMIDNQKIDQLQSIMVEQYGNNGKNPEYSQDAKSVTIIIDMPIIENGIEIEKIIFKLIKTFNKVNAQFKNNIELNIVFNYGQTAPPPPPPPSGPIN